MHENLYNTATGTVFRVTDKNSNSFALTAFSHIPSVSAESKAEHLVSFASERASALRITKAVCPAAIDAHVSEEPLDFTCDSAHLQVLLGVDVSVMDNEGTSLSSKVLMITDSRGEDHERRVDFTATMLHPYSAGGRLNDAINNSPTYRSLTNRYLLYTTIAVQLVEAVKKMHSTGFAHLSIGQGNMFCVSPTCEEVVLGGFGSVFAKKAPILASAEYASELMQNSVRFESFQTPDSKEIDRTAIQVLKEYAQRRPDFDAARKVDWYALGGTLFNIVSGYRIVADSKEAQQTGSRAIADFIMQSMSDKQLVDKVKDKQSRRLYDRIREQVAESLLLIDGLLAVDRTKRISFDSDEGRDRVSTSLRANKAIMSALQTETASSGATCASFISQTGRIIPELSRATVPSFLQQICGH